jgi:hypothetical protein
MPAFGFDAVPSPIKNRTMLPGCQVADALGEATADPTGPAGAPLLTGAAAAVGEDPFNSRRLVATATHPEGPDTGSSPLPSPNHAKTAPLGPPTPPEAAARLATADPTGRTADAACTDGPPPATDIESFTTTTDSEMTEEPGNETDSRTTELPSAASDVAVGSPGRL